MTASLKEFLQAHPPDTDLRLLSWHAEGPQSLRCVLEAYPWWRGEADGPVAEERLEITFHNVHGSNVALGWRAAEVEDLAVSTDDPHLWPYGTWATIFGNARLPDPGRFFVDFYELFHHQLRAGGAVPFPFEHQSFRGWAERVTGSDTYKLLDGPARVMEAACPLLDAQGVAYRLLRSQERSTDHLQVVWIGESWVVCTDAVVEHPR